ncbi:MAG: DUF1684 domain-containing protein [Chitinophagales bacterium]|nr:DUF1684 domain-containing protein [Chitinophagales bacterium]
MYYRLLLLCTLLVSGTVLFAQSSNAYKKEIKKFRKAHIKELVKDDHAPINKKSARQLDFFPADPSYNVQAKIELTPDAESFEMATYSGQTRPYVQYGIATFELNGQEIQLAIYQSLKLRAMPMYRDYLFLPFKDATNGESTYGGGRYIDLKLSDIKEGQLDLDLNKTYNPYCAYSDGYSCPIPPVENHLDIAIEAGERGWFEKK